ncbi:sugar phosphate isomerase/epimerase family protein [Novosphingobium pentaromativorans]|uniref:Xylose isomerase domain-containing protein TIM barrel n=1 Tax=Novosphingobium pentaromativorans US6-1 TaxID=1088721 RepID=G6EA87_9SPHN|nr:sugar phosphate isomerase/epimerase family protein [Novosphingobium pentaromativorans]AIT80774.1 xylose isomerase [Novosphingobium pentaromativorans US6-1]EHJ61802.1 Xylose isomerase domain-containing protein TIM barrel [Novosphingobium pentaromativorans US6-1]
MRVGTDSSKFPVSTAAGAIGVLQQAADLGLEGVFFRSAFELSPKLDRKEIEDVATAARELDLYLEVGAAKINPFATPEAPEIRSLGDGDYMLGLERIIRALTAAGIKEIWTATANYQFRFSSIYACDRFRTDVEWTDQLAATLKVMHRIAPVLRDTGAHLNVETHEEISTFEVVRLVEEAGPDAFGITFDTANVLVRGEDPLAAARRVAPYVRSTHIRDVALVRTNEGISRFLAPVGEGVIDWASLLKTLSQHSTPTLSIEGVIFARGEMNLFIDDPLWWASHPDLTKEEFARVEGLTRGYADQVNAGLRPGLDELRQNIGPAEALEFITTSAAALRQFL